MALAGWNPNNKLKLIIDESKVDGSLSNFPVYINLSSSAGISNFDVTSIFDELTTVTGTKKIAITDSNDDQCYVEIESWDWSNEKAVLWVKVPVVSSVSGTVLYLYYDSNQPDNTTYIGDTGDSAAQNVWDDNFVAVYHMAQDPSVGGACVLDSTSNTKHGTPAGSMTSGDLVDGRIGKGLDFDGTNDTISLPALGFSGDDTATLEASVNADEIRRGTIFSFGTSSNNQRFTLRTANESGQDYLFYFYANDLFGSGNACEGVWRNVVARYDATSSSRIIYSDYTNVGSDSPVNANFTDNNYYIGSAQGSELFKGTIDEIRMSDIARPNEWLKATHYSNLDSLVSFESCGWNPNNRLILTIDGSKVDEDLTDFPVCITLSSGTGINTFDATSIFDGLTSSGTDSYTKLLLHMDDAGLTDSSSNQYTTTLSGGMGVSSTQSKFGGYSAYFDGSDDFLTVPDHEDWDFGTGDFTVDCFFYLSTIDQFNNIVNHSDDIVNGWSIDVNTSNYPRLVAHIGSWGVFLTSDTAVLADTWYHIAVVRNGNTFSMYLNGNLVASDTDSSAILASSELLQIGHFQINAGTHRYFSGYIDELCISKGIARWTSNFTPPTGPYGSSWDNRKKIAITDSNDNQLYTEIEVWDHVDEEVVLWTKVPAIVSGMDTTLYLYYDLTQPDNTTYVGDTGDVVAQNVWDDNFVGVWHLSNVGDQTDSTSYGFDLYKGTSVTSQIETNFGHGIEFVGGSNSIENMLSVQDDSPLDLTTLTVTVAVQSMDVTVNKTFAAKGARGSWDYNWMINMDASSRLQMGYWDGSWRQATGTINLQTATPYVLSATLDTAGAEVFVNNISDGTLSYSGTPPNTTAALTVGGQEHYTSGYYNPFDGIIGDVQLSKIVRPDAWIKATYYSSWNDLITFSEEEPVLTTFIFSNPNPTDLSTVYGTTTQLYLTTTVTGSATNYIYDATFYDAYNDSIIGSTVSGVESGQPAGVIMSTPSGIDYQWYVTSTSSGSQDTSDTYTFTNRFLCSGQVQVSDVPASGIPVRLYLRDTGELIGSDISTTESGIFSIETLYNGYHYIVGLYASTVSGVDITETNALIYDHIKPE